MFQVCSWINMVKKVHGVFSYKALCVFDKKKHFSAIVFSSEIDSKVAIRQKCRIYDSKIEKYSYVARNTLIQSANIGKFCSISEGCNIGLPSHPTEMLSTSPVFLEGENYLHYNFSEIPFDNCPRTIIENDVWIGAHAQIKSGVTIENGAIIAAGAVVTKSVPAYAIVGGVPAKIIRYRFSEEHIEKLQEMKWWNWSDDRIRKEASLFSDIEKCLKEELF